MTLATHAVVGSLIGAVTAHALPVGIVAAVLSHPIMDTIPHWDYSLSTAKGNKKDPMQNDMAIGGKAFYIDLLKIAFDFCLGMAIVIAVFYTQPKIVFFSAVLCALLAVLPDPLQFVYWKTRNKILAPFQRFHMYMHAKSNFNTQPIFGITAQAAIIIVILVLIKYIV